MPKRGGKKKPLLSDLKIGRNPVTGQVTLGGKFASKKQIASWKSARKRRGLSATIPSAPSKEKRERSTASRKGALTRKANTLGAEFAGERATPVAGFKKRQWSLSVPAAESIQAVLDRESFDRDDDKVLVQVIVEFVNEDGENVAESSKFRIASESELAASIENFISQTLATPRSHESVTEVLDIIIEFSFAKGG